MVLVGPILADTYRVRENGGLGTIPAAVAAENDVRDNGEARDSDALMPENSASAPSQPAILFFSN